MSELPRIPDARDLARWSAALAGIARTGMGFTESLYERERYEEVLHVAADIRAAAAALEEATEIERDTDHFVQEWLANVGEEYRLRFCLFSLRAACGSASGRRGSRLIIVDAGNGACANYRTCLATFHT